MTIGILLFSSFVVFAESNVTTGDKMEFLPAVPIVTPSGPKLRGLEKLPPNSTGLKHKKRRFKSSRNPFGKDGIEDPLSVDDAGPKADLTITKVEFIGDTAKVFVKNIGTKASRKGVGISGNTHYKNNESIIVKDGSLVIDSSWQPLNSRGQVITDLPAISVGRTIVLKGPITRNLTQTWEDEGTGKITYGKTYPANIFNAQIHNFSSYALFLELDYDNNSITVDLPPE